nr:MAG TPA: hypothetical protein [Caudoviricetes sp.]
MSLHNSPPSLSYRSWRSFTKPSQYSSLFSGS